MNISLGSDILMDIGLSSDFLMNISLSSDLFMDIGLGSRVQVSISNRGVIYTSIDTAICGMGQDSGGSSSKCGSSGGVGRSHSMSSIADSGSRVSSIGSSWVSGVSVNVLTGGHGDTSKDGNKGLHCEMY